MNSFMNPHFAQTHPGVGRLERLAQALQVSASFIDSAKGLATLLLSALVATLMVVANQIIETWTDGHLLVAWTLLWVIAFSLLAIFAQPILAFVVKLTRQWGEWKDRQYARGQDARMWEVAQQDPRLMSEIRCALQRSAS